MGTGGNRTAAHLWQGHPAGGPWTAARGNAAPPQTLPRHSTSPLVRCRGRLVLNEPGGGAIFPRRALPPPPLPVVVDPAGQAVSLPCTAWSASARFGAPPPPASPSPIPPTLWDLTPRALPLPRPHAALQGVYTLECGEPRGVCALRCHAHALHLSSIANLTRSAGVASRKSPHCLKYTAVQYCIYTVHTYRTCSTHNGSRECGGTD